METKEEKFELTITADSITSTCDEFTENNLADGWRFRPVDVYFDGVAGKREGKEVEKNGTISNKTLSRLACNLYEEKLDALSGEERQEFPIYQPNPEAKILRGIYKDLEKCKKIYETDSYKYVVDYYSDGKFKFAFFYYHVFSNIAFVQECLKRYGEKDDKFVLEYQRKTEKQMENAWPEDYEQIIKASDVVYKTSYAATLLESKNIIFRGAPGTGKSYLAKEIAADIVSDGYTKRFGDLTDEQKEQVEFVQFHPSYDYTDFVEGLRPIVQDGSMGFELKKGVFKAFADRARTNYENFQKPASVEEVKNYVFIIDEINRGEISKIFGELFFSIDPGYRGRAGEVSTQYANLHEKEEGKFYIPPNVYIIGTMNDIDRSVESFDFAMRRRFRFVEVTAKDSVKMLCGVLGDEVRKEAEKRMEVLNNVIKDTEGLNENYQIGASYFLKLKTVNFDVLWTGYLQPLLQEYTNGMYDAKNTMDKFADAYGYKKPGEGLPDGATQN